VLVKQAAARQATPSYQTYTRKKNGRALLVSKNTLWRGLNDIIDDQVLVVDGLRDRVR